jgi:rRNA maturation RNase YbeY
MLDVERVDRHLERGAIEIAPIAFMRGRTLNDSFVILDEAQNTTAEQMKMLLTRIGYNTKVVVTGDVTQIDLPSGKMSGLVEAEKIICGVEGIAFVHFNDRDVVRHPLVQRIVRAYEAYSADGIARQQPLRFGSGITPSPVQNNSPNKSQGRKLHDATSNNRLVLNKQRKHAIDMAAIKSFLSKLTKDQGKHAMSLSVVLLDDEAMQQYNRKYRGFDKTTDVLSFCGDGDYLGDILISVETAFAQARKSPVLTLESNLRRLALHGFLHLTGYDHETDNGEMRAIEIRLRRRFKC